MRHVVINTYSPLYTVDNAKLNESIVDEIFVSSVNLFVAITCDVSKELHSEVVISFAHGGKNIPLSKLEVWSLREVVSQVSHVGCRVLES